eukprot:362231-Chlamydomonas_euryale.AAC.9
MQAPSSPSATVDLPCPAPTPSASHEHLVQVVCLSLAALIDIAERETREEVVPAVRVGPRVAAHRSSRCRRRSSSRSRSGGRPNLAC